MFYSQFILAKKGPLGTIWIAAHLERKLRKNQVADTDIGVSVDSILFPEVPIALRLSSHLLLGVVRIYSRKVNYLFHDCSEALLKIKQAFRSTAVDLPPEESTAPYHSITLPETFHLDDFELPDSALQGDFVDHHVSTKEQITLQDIVDGVGFPTSQFGLDERFGDGNASQIGFDLDEDLFLDQHPSSQLASIPLGSDEGAMHRGQSSVSLVDMEIDDDQSKFDKNKGTEASKESCELSKDCDKEMLSNMGDLERNDGSSDWHGYNIQTPDLNEVFSGNDHIGGPSSSQLGISNVADEVPPQNLVECAQAPSTPGLIEEMISANEHGSPALSPQGKASPSIGEEAVKPDNSTGPSLPFESLDGMNDNGLANTVTMTSEVVNIAQRASSPISVLTDPKAALAISDKSHLGGEQKGANNQQTDDFGSNEKKDKPVADPIDDNGEAVLPEIVPSDGLVSSNCALDSSNLQTPLDKSVADTEVVIATSELCGQTLIPGQVSASDDTPFGDNMGSTILINEDHAKDMNPFNNDASANNSCHLKSCTSQLNQVSAISAADGVLVENAPGFSLEEVRNPSATPSSEKALHVGDSSFEMPGDDSHVANATDTDLVVQQRPGCELSDPVPGDSKTNELSSGPLPKENHLDQLNCSSSSEFPEPEKMLLAPNGYIEHANELGQLTTEKGVTESDGSVNRIGNLSGKKRRLMESTPVLQNGSSVKLSGKPRVRRNVDYIPDDDDLLASILVGKRTSTLRMGPTPPPKLASLKRPRLTARSGVTKRKVLLDDTVVLHADAIRQQLINTEDIRRVRKKAPCSRPEIWMIQKSLLEEDIFNELIITGVSAELNSLHTRRYDLETNACHSHAEAPKEVESSRSLGSEVSGRGTVEPTMIMPDRMDGVTEGPSGTSASIEALSGKEVGKFISQDQSGSHSDLPQLLDNAQPCAISLAEPNVQDRLECNTTADCTAEGASVRRSENIETLSEMSDGMCLYSGQQSVHQIIQPAHELSEMDDRTLNTVANVSSKELALIENETCGRVNDQTALGAVNDDDLICDANVYTATDASIMEGNRSEVDAGHLKCSQNDHADGRSGNGEASMSTIDCSLPGIEAGLPTDSSTVIGDELVDQHVLNIGEGPNFDTIFAEGAQKASVSALHPINEIENVPSAVGENSGLQELNLEGCMDVESAPMDNAANKECSDFCSAVDGNDTEFLNVDDEADYDEEAYNDVPNPEEAQSLENSGWSSRTRGVARYLKNLFDEESGRGRKFVAMDHLLAGKTRKEASRMFFETLVLKTRDYIEVGQEKPLDCVNIKPRIKLLKSEF